MRYVTAAQWDDEFVVPADRLSLDDPTVVDVPEYLTAAEQAAEDHRVMAEAAEMRLMDLLTPGWGYLFAMRADATEAEAAEFRDMDNRHFSQHGREIRRLRNLRDYHVAEWRALQGE